MFQNKIYVIAGPKCEIQLSHMTGKNKLLLQGSDHRKNSR
jgi:hypothetical protein